MNVDYHLVIGCLTSKTGEKKRLPDRYNRAIHTQEEGSVWRGSENLQRLAKIRALPRTAPEQHTRIVMPLW